MCKHSVRGAWLTVNRACNLRCLWCYAEGTRYSKSDDMPEELALEMIELLRFQGIRSLVFIGGEPLLWEPLFRINAAAKYNSIATAVVTNGSLFVSDRIVGQTQPDTFNSINISLKADSPSTYLELTKANAYHQIVRGMNNLSARGVKFDTSLTLNSLTAPILQGIVKMAIDNGSQNINIQFCSATVSNGEPSKGFMLSPSEVVECITKNYEALNSLTAGKLMIEQSLPLCLWPTDFIRTLQARGQVSFGCHVLQRSGLIIDPSGSVIPCNCLHECRLGRFGVDFEKHSFSEFWANPQMAEFYDKIICYPADTCVNCDQYQKCGGGCPLQWFVFKPNDIIPPERR